MITIIIINLNPIKKKNINTIKNSLDITIMIHHHSNKNIMIKKRRYLNIDNNKNHSIIILIITMGYKVNKVNNPNRTKSTGINCLTDFLYYTI